jgi:hypothetical protein
VSARTRRMLLAAFASLVIGLSLAGPATAQDVEPDDTSDQIVLNGELTIPEGRSVDTAVIFHGPATIDGTVTGSVVVFDGRADIGGSVQGDVVVFNGAVNVRSGAEVGGDIVSRQTPTIAPDATVRGQQTSVSTRFDAADLGFASRVAWWVGYSVSTLVLGLLVLLLAPGLDAAIVRTARERTGAALGLGALAFFVLPIVAVLFLVIVIAIPLGLFLLLALAFLYTMGYVAGAHALGRMLMKPPSSRFLAFVVGWAILRVLALIPILGGLLWVLASIAGLGVLWVGARRTAAEAAPLPAAPPPPAVPA